MNEGILKYAPKQAKSSEILNPRSAKTPSPCSMYLRKPLFWVITLSETRPPQALEIKEMEPVGIMAIKTLAVLCFL